MSSSQKYRNILEGNEGDGDSRSDEFDERVAPGRSFAERQLEWLTLGMSAILFGAALLLQNRDVMRIIYPLIAGSLILISAIVQKIGRNWNVSIFSWVIGVLLLSFGITNGLAAYQGVEGFNFVYFVGSIFILGGIVILLQIFRRG